MATPEQIQALREKSKGFGDAIVGAYMSVHSPSWGEDMSIETVVRHAADCENCQRAFEIRKTRLLSLSRHPAGRKGLWRESWEVVVTALSEVWRPKVAFIRYLVATPIILLIIWFLTKN